MGRLKSLIKRILWIVCPDIMSDYMYKNAHKRHFHFHGGYDGKDMSEYIDETFQYFLTEDELKDKKSVRHLIRDIIQCDRKYGTNPTEYFCYHFNGKTAEMRAAYLPRKQKDILLSSKMGPDMEPFRRIKDKYQFYADMKPFFRREACNVESASDEIEFCRLLTKNGRLICKPSQGGCGYGIEIINIEDFGGDAGQAFNYLISKGSYIAEEIVEQDPRIAELNASSLNTFRIPVFRTQKGVAIFYPSIRIGRSGSIVDNAGAGGVFAAIDPESGVILTDGFDKHGNHYVEHPDSHVRFKGMQIPEWDALKKFVTELHLSMPEVHKYIAYDIALSNKGWVVIEANWGEISMPQIEFGRGLKEEFKALLFG